MPPYVYLCALCLLMQNYASFSVSFLKVFEGSLCMCICTCILCLCLCLKLCQGHFNFFFRKAFEGSRRPYCGPLMVPLSAVLTRLLLLLTLTVHEKTTCRRLYHDDITLSGDIQSNSHIDIKYCHRRNVECIARISGQSHYLVEGTDG